MDWIERISELTEPQADLVRYLDTMRQLRKGMKLPEGWHYHGMEDFLLQNGQWFDAFGDVPKGAYDTLKECFGNSALNVIRFPKLAYVEGVSYNIIPVHHAWNIDNNSNVIDATWSKHSTLGKAYLGVKFPAKKVLTKLDKGCTVLDDWRNDWPVYRKEWKA